MVSPHRKQLGEAEVVDPATALLVQVQLSHFQHGLMSVITLGEMTLRDDTSRNPMPFLHQHSEVGN